MVCVLEGTSFESVSVLLGGCPDVTTGSIGGAGKPLEVVEAKQRHP